MRQESSLGQEKHVGESWTKTVEFHPGMGACAMYLKRTWSNVAVISS